MRIIPSGCHDESWDVEPLPRFTAALRPSDGARPAFTLIELLVVIAIIGVLASLMLPVVNRTKVKALNAVCTSQLRQLGVATRLWADEHNNILPTAEILPSMPVNPAMPLPRICDVLGPYVGKAGGGTNSAAILKCPADNAGRFVTEGSSYEWNASLNGHRMDETTSSSGGFTLGWTGPGGTWQQTNGTVELAFPPVRTPLLLDYDDFHSPRPPPKTGKNVVFMDNHVAPLEISQAAQ